MSTVVNTLIKISNLACLASTIILNQYSDMKQDVN